MFEAFKSEAERTEDATKEMSPGQVQAFRIAAVLLATHALLGLGISVLAGGKGLPLLQTVVALLLARALYQLKSNWAAVVLVILPVGAIAVTSMLALHTSLSTEWLVLGPVWGLTLAMFLLLRGDPSEGRRIAAIGLYALPALPFYFLAILGALAMRLGG
jgi:uncharacterized membrane protein YjjP (DUF1212 family)